MAGEDERICDLLSKTSISILDYLLILDSEDGNKEKIALVQNVVLPATAAHALTAGSAAFADEADTIVGGSGAGVNKYFGTDNGGSIGFHSFPDADSGAKGMVQLATAAETTTGTDGGKAITPDGLAGSIFGKQVAQLKLVKDDASLAVGDGAISFEMPAEVGGMNLVGAYGFVSTPSSSGTPQYQIHNVTDGVDMLSTKITIDANQKSSRTAGTPAVVDSAHDDVATGDILRIDKDTAGTGEKGDLITLIFGLP